MRKILLIQRQINWCKFWVMYACHASRLSVTICPIKMPVFKMRCLMPESYNVLKICLEVIVAIDDYSQFNYVSTSTKLKFINKSTISRSF